MCASWQALARELQVHGTSLEVTARLVDAAGVPSNVGLLQVQSGDGSFGTVCGMNLEAVDVVCRQLGSASLVRILRDGFRGVLCSVVLLVDRL